MRSIRNVLLSLAALAAPAAAQFDLFGWTLFENPSYPSSGFMVNGDVLTFSGPSYPDPCFAPGADGYAKTIAPFDATVSVRMQFLPDDFSPGLDTPMYVVNGVKHLLAEDCTDCEVVFHVHAGESFGFGNHSADCLFGTAVSVWSQLRLFPEPQGKSVAGPSLSAAFGQAVARIGDVDLDGVSDVAVGAPHASFAGTDSGRVVVLSGADATPLFGVNGLSAGENFGSSVAGVGDVDHDGIPDLLVGAPNASFAASAAGRCYLLSGAGGAVILARDGDNAGAHLGQSVAGPGDCNGDGTPDVLVGAPGSNAFGVGAGRALLLSGALGPALVVVGGAAPGDQCGFAVAAAGDLDGDGARDLLVGSPNASPRGLSHAGSVRAVSSAHGTLLHKVDGTVADGQLGASVGGLGDLDADGVDDLVAGAPYTSGELEHVGRVTVYSGSDGALLQSTTGSAAGDALGWSVGDAGDIDDDGRGDVLVGAIGSGGLDPGAAGTARVLSGRDGSLLAIFGGVAVGDQTGAAVAGAGDLDGNGLPDVIVGSPGSDGPAQNAGKVTFYSAIHVIWADLGGGIAGSSGTPTLEGKSLLVANGLFRLLVDGAKPNAPATLVVGFAELGAAFKGGLLWPQPEVLLPGLIVGGGGSLVISATWPAGVPSGFELLLQAWIVDASAVQGLAATNGLRGLTP
ncbi:MAG TPA: integrin alpha [Planctomycetota bacterium]|nr:integrin alpha [Planctomycetota bacterium]